LDHPHVVKRKDGATGRTTEGKGTMKVTLDKRQFGPWALVTGASSGIGKEFARQIAASGINVVLVARRDALLAELGRAISQEFDVQYRALAMDLSQEGFIARLADATHDIDIGRVVSNAGTQIRASS
jgi:short-subunit dehydrogenase